MEVIFGAKSTTKSSHSGITNVTCASRGKRVSTPGSSIANKGDSKKRGVYVEKWNNPKQHLEDNKRQARSKVKPRLPVPPPESQQKLLTSAPAESKISTFTRLLGTPDPIMRVVRRRSLKRTPTLFIPKQNSKLSNSSAQPKPDGKPQRNIIEENKNNVKKMKFRSKVLKQVYAKKSEKTLTFKSQKEIVQTPSNTSKLTRGLSDAHWSNIFPSDRENTGMNLLKQYICNYEQEDKPARTDDTDKNNIESIETTLDKEKQKPIYDFFIDLLESVYGEDNPNDAVSLGHSKSSHTSFEIDEQVAEKLYIQQEDSKLASKNHYTIQDDDNVFVEQSRQLADYYNSRTRLIQDNTRRRGRPTINKRFPYTDPTYTKAEKKRKKPKKPNLLNLLKKQLSEDYPRPEEPVNMYEALLTIAKKNQKGREMYMDNYSSKEPSDLERVCRFKRRNVISPSTRLPRNKANPMKEFMFNSFYTRPKYKSGSVVSMPRRESNHSLEVLGFDYEDVMRSTGPDTEYSESETASKSGRNITKLNEGITTVTQYWKR